MKPLRIILVMMESLLPFGDAPSRWYHVLVGELNRRNHRLTIFALTKDSDERDRVRSGLPGVELRLYQRNARRGLMSKWQTLCRPNSSAFSEEMRRDVHVRLREGFDVLHLESVWTGWLTDEYIQRSLMNIHFISKIDLNGAPVGNWKQAIQRHRVIATEVDLIRRYRHLNALSAPMAEEIRRINPKADVSIIPLGIDPSLYEFIPQQRRRRMQPIVGFIGSMFWQPNLSAAERLLDRLWPAIHARVPNSRLLIVGRQARRALERYVNLPGVTILEDVPEIQPYFEELDVLVYAPRGASGMKVKILEAMSFGVPVVTTKDGVEGLPAVDGVHAGIGSSDEDLVERATALLRNPLAQERQRLAARSMIESHCSPKATVDAIEARYASILGIS